MATGPLKKEARSIPLYEADFHRWSQEQGQALRGRRAADVDWENVAEEIETLGRSEKSEIASRLHVLLVHLLKWQFQSDARSNSWRGSIVEQRKKLQRSLRENPSLRSYPAEVIDEEYESARLKAAGETGLPDNVFPERLTYSVADVLLDTFYPGEAE